MSHIYFYFKNNDGKRNNDHIFDNVQLNWVRYDYDSKSYDNKVYNLYDNDYAIVSYDKQKYNSDGYILSLSTHDPLSSHIEGVNFSRFDRLQLLFKFNDTCPSDVIVCIFGLYIDLLCTEANGSIMAYFDHIYHI